MEGPIDILIVKGYKLNGKVIVKLLCFYLFWGLGWRQGNV